ncbi:MAG: YggT family protein [Candidatus Saccharibacteria bacterium]|nr:YggT family protein [Candidatus Saccharibacteria bacterium]
MTDPVRRVTQTTVQDGDTTRTVREVDDARVNTGAEQNTITRLIAFIAGVLLVLLAFRFVLILFGANKGNGFVDFIYSVSYPFARPFFGMFGYDLQYGVARVEISTLVAMAVYGLVAYAIIKLVNIASRR